MVILAVLTMEQQILLVQSNNAVYVVTKVKVMSRSRLFQGQFEVKDNPRSNFMGLDFYHGADGGPSIERHSCFIIFSFSGKSTYTAELPNLKPYNVWCFTWKYNCERSKASSCLISHTLKLMNVRTGKRLYENDTKMPQMCKIQ